MEKVTGKVLRTNDYGLCFFEDDNGHRYAFTSNELEGYHGEEFDEIGLKRGATVTATVEDDRVKTAKMD